jgi:hypothetical protein
VDEGAGADVDVAVGAAVCDIVKKAFDTVVKPRRNRENVCDMKSDTGGRC